MTAFFREIQQIHHPVKLAAIRQVSSDLLASLTSKLELGIFNRTGSGGCYSRGSSLLQCPTSSGVGLSIIYLTVIPFILIIPKSLWTLEGNLRVKIIHQPSLVPPH